MKITFRQGILSYPEARGVGQRFLQLSGNNINLIASHGPIVVTFAHKDQNYLWTESDDIQNAWVSVPATCWLYWDINLTSGVRTFGYTTVEPTFGPSQPVTLTNDLHWFDTTNNVMKVYTGGRFVEKVRVFAAKFFNNTFVPLGKNGSKPFAGTQVGIKNVRALAGHILYDATGKPVIRAFNNTFFTTVSDFYTSGNVRITGVRLESDIVIAEAGENIPAYSVVKYVDFNKVRLAGYVDAGSTLLAIATHDALMGEPVTLVVQGVVTNEQWNWTTAGETLWVLANGQLTNIDPHLAQPVVYQVSKPAIARVLDSRQIIFMQGLGKEGPPGSGLDSVVEDISPALGGNLTVNGYSIISVNDGDIRIEPDGNGNLILDGYRFPNMPGVGGQVLTIGSPDTQLQWTSATGLGNVVEDTTPQLGGNLDVNGFQIISTNNGDIILTPNGSGSVVLDGQFFPQTPGTSNQVLTIGSPTTQLVWRTVNAGLTDIVQDTTPQLGGNLDVNGNEIVSTNNGNIVLAPNGSGSVVLDGQFFPQSAGTTGQALMIGSPTTQLVWGNVQASTSAPVVLQMSASDLVTALETGSSVAYVRAPQAFTITDVRASLLTASSSGAVQVDINVNGNSILSTVISIDANENTSTTSSTPPVISTTSISDDDEITIDIDSSGVGAAGLIVTIIGYAN